MEYALAFIFGTVITWVGLLIVIPIAQKMADFSLPPWGETLWKLAVVAAIVNAVTVPLDLVHFWVAAIAGAIVFWIIMWRWFDLDFFGLMVIVAITWILRHVSLMLLAGLFAPAV